MELKDEIIKFWQNVALKQNNGSNGPVYCFHFPGDKLSPSPPVIVLNLCDIYFRNGCRAASRKINQI
jgi:hypothetical protein